MKESNDGSEHAESVGKRNLHEAFVQVDDPFLEHRDSAGLLRPESPPMKRLIEGYDDVLPAPAHLDAVRAG